MPRWSGLNRGEEGAAETVWWAFRSGISWGDPRELCLVAWPLGITVALHTSPPSAASGAPPVSPVLIGWLGLGAQNLLIRGISRSMVVRQAPLGRSRSSVLSALCFLLLELLPQRTDTRPPALCPQSSCPHSHTNAAVGKQNRVALEDST